jgi:16S rRNA (adenine1518-N6/adenine1519-N6)-dimethyltransferase
MSDEQGPVSPPKQTLSFLRHLLRSRGIEPKAKLGQNFLIDLNLLDLIVRTAQLAKCDAVLEVGSGTGTLTGKLAQAAGCVVTVEIDDDFYTLVRELMQGYPNVKCLHADVLRTKNELNPDILASFDLAAREQGCARRKLVANLPYVVATPVIANLLLTDDRFERMVVMVQWEIAERMTASPGTHHYSSLAVLVQALADVAIIRRVGPTVFWPKPKVDSAIVLIVPNREKRAKVPDLVRFRVFLRNLYAHRRKNLRGALVGWPGGRRDKAEVDRQLAQLGISGQVRAEDLDIEQHLRLCEVFG